MDPLTLITSKWVVTLTDHEKTKASRTRVSDPSPRHLQRVRDGEGDFSIHQGDMDEFVFPSGVLCEREHHETRPHPGSAASRRRVRSGGRSQRGGSESGETCRRLAYKVVFSRCESGRIRYQV